MKTAILLPLLIYGGFSYPQNATVKGIVVTHEGMAVPYSNLSLQELSISTIAGEDGSFTFLNIPFGDYHLYVSHTGYVNKTISISVNSPAAQFNIELEKSLIETSTIDVTSSFNPTDIFNSIYSISSVSPRTLQRLRNQNIASTLQGVPGVNNLSSGSSIGKPVIRGLSSQSILIVHDGVKHESQQWGDEHGPEISLFDIDRIEIMRGPASLTYGSDGIGGVINIISKPLQFASKNSSVVFGNFDLNGFSMNTEGAANFMLGLGTADAGIKGYLGYRKSKNITTPIGNLEVYTPEGKRIIQGGELSNSSSSEFEGGTKIGFKNTFGTMNFEYQNFKREIQIHEDPAENPDATANQKILTNHFEAKGKFYLSKQIQIEPVISYEIQDRKEFASAEDKNIDAASLNLNLKVFQGDIRLDHKLSKDVNGTLGTSVTASSNRTLGIEKLIPNYNASGIGAYISESLEKRFFSFSLGGRFTIRVKESKKLFLKLMRMDFP